MAGEGRFASLLGAYLEELRAHRYSRSAQDHATYVLPRFLSHLSEEGVSDLRMVSSAHLVSFLRKLQVTRARHGGELSLATRAIHLRTIRGFFAFLERRGFILMNPAAGVSLPSGRPRLPRGVPSEAEARRLMSAPMSSTALGKRDRAILETLYGTGVRVGECSRIDVSDLDLRGMALWVRNGKGRKDRLVPLAGRAVAALEVYLREVRPQLVHDPKEPALFLSRAGGRLRRVTLQRMVRQYGSSVGVRATPHALRHACATHLLQGGASLREVQEILGHQHLDTTAIYTKVDVRELRRVLAKAHPREKGARLTPCASRRR